jgi:hypothetical protein
VHQEAPGVKPPRDAKVIRSLRFSASGRYRDG